MELAETWINGSNTRDLVYQYDALGNIKSKTGTLPGDTDVMGYSYGGGGGPGPHAVTSATVGGVFNTLSYDANGAVIRYDIAGTTEDKWLAYNVANQPTKIVIGSSLTDTTPQVSEEFRYDPDGHRYARRSSWQEGGATHQEHVSYVGNVEIVNDISNGEVLWVYKTRLSPSVMHVKAEWLGLIDGQPHSWNESHFEYAHRDHLGSIELVTDDSGAELHRLAFEPFGSRRSKYWSGSIDPIELNALLARGQGHAPRVRGFTGHEHLDRTGFIHMNGRVYDSVLGRFLSPDSFVQFPAFSQNWNRYSYIDNKPTSFTDPTGHFQELSGVEGGTNEDGYGGTVGGYGLARAKAVFEKMLDLGPPEYDDKTRKPLMSSLPPTAFDSLIGVAKRLQEELELAAQPFGGTHEGMIDAAVAKLKQLYPHSDRENVEYGFIIYKMDGHHYVTPAVTDFNPIEVSTLAKARVFVPDGARVVAIGHTHPSSYDGFSDRDRTVGSAGNVQLALHPTKSFTRVSGIDVFMTNRSGKLYQITPFGREANPSGRVFDADQYR